MVASHALLTAWLRCRQSLLLDFLPPELLELIIRRLDVRSLCTARLVCTDFCLVASNWVKSVKASGDQLQSYPDTHFDCFPYLSRVTIFGVKKEHVPLLAVPALGHAVTHLTLEFDWSTLGEAPPPILPPLPNLRVLRTGRIGLDNTFQFPPSLQELHLSDPVSKINGDPLTRLTLLTSLSLPCGHRDPPFEGLSHLTALRQLDIGGTPSILPFVGALSLLTHLEWMCFNSPTCDLTPFMHLQKLEHLHIMSSRFVMELDHFRAIGQISSLRSLILDAEGPRLLLDADLSLLKPLSRLTLLEQSSCCMDGRSLLSMNIEGLKTLNLGEAGMLGNGTEAVSILQRAIGCETLHFSWGRRSNATVDVTPLSVALSGLTALQTLKLNTNQLRGSCFEAIGLLTGLLYFHWKGDYVTNADVMACTRMRSLRMLSLLPARFSPYGPITLDGFLGLARLPELHWLQLHMFMGIWGTAVTPDIKAQMDGGRLSRGLPPLDLSFAWTVDY
jgi:hypothetical protein